MRTSRLLAGLATLGVSFIPALGACGNGDDTGSSMMPSYDASAADVTTPDAAADASAPDAAVPPASATVHPMNYVEVGASSSPVTMTIGSSSWTVPTANTEGQVVVVIPMIDVGTGTAATLSRDGQTLWTLQIVPEPASTSAPGASALTFLENLRTFQANYADAGAGVDAGARPDINAVEALIQQAAAASTTMGTISGTTATLDATSLRALDAVFTALHEGTVVLPAANQVRSLKGLLSGPLSAVSDAVAFIMNDAQRVAGIPEDQIQAPDGWLGSMLSFVAEHTPNSDGSLIGQAVVAVFGKTEAQTIATDLEAWAASHRADPSETQALDAVQDVQDFATLAASAPQLAGLVNCQVGSICLADGSEPCACDFGTFETNSLVRWTIGSTTCASPATPAWWASFAQPTSWRTALASMAR